MQWKLLTCYYFFMSCYYVPYFFKSLRNVYSLQGNHVGHVPISNALINMSLDASFSYQQYQTACFM